MNRAKGSRVGQTAERAFALLPRGVSRLSSFFLVLPFFYSNESTPPVSFSPLAAIGRAILVAEAVWAVYSTARKLSRRRAAPAHSFFPAVLTLLTSVVCLWCSASFFHLLLSWYVAEAGMLSRLCALCLFGVPWAALVNFWIAATGFDHWIDYESLCYMAFPCAWLLFLRCYLPSLSPP